jgi:hypothetical protein
VPSSPLGAKTEAASPSLPRTRGDATRAASSSIKDRWRFARLLRSQGKLRAALAECLTIANAGDVTWSPIALLEAIRLYAGPLADSAQVVALAGRLILEWPADALVPEARQLRCRALDRLGRGAECAAPPTP